MNTRLKRLILALPWAVLGTYGFLLLDYVRYFDRNLNYIKPIIPQAPEDVLGFGIWPTWVLALILILVTSFIAYKSGMRRPAYFVSLALIFLLVSVADYYLYKTLFIQVIS